MSPSPTRESKSVKGVGRSKGTYANRRSKYTNVTITNSDGKDVNFGSQGKRKIKISLPKLNLPPIVEE